MGENTCRTSMLQARLKCWITDQSLFSPWTELLPLVDLSMQDRTSEVVPQAVEGTLVLDNAISLWETGSHK